MFVYIIIYTHICQYWCMKYSMMWCNTSSDWSRLTRSFCVLEMRALFVFATGSRKQLGLSPMVLTAGRGLFVLVTVADKDFYLPNWYKLSIYQGFLSIPDINLRWVGIELLAFCLHWMYGKLNTKLNGDGNQPHSLSHIAKPVYVFYIYLCIHNYIHTLHLLSIVQYT